MAKRQSHNNHQCGRKEPTGKSGKEEAAVERCFSLTAAITTGLKVERAECCLLNCVDDSTGKIHLRFAVSENTQDVLLTLWEYVRKNGIPRSIYTDRFKVYKAEGKLTDFGRAMKELNVETIYAHSPQAKGRVERVNRTLQDRLVKALRREGISNIAEANKYLRRKIY